jgi:hypothetical protein
MGLREFTSVPADPREWGRWMRAQFITADQVAPGVVDATALADNAVTNPKFRDSAALSVIGRPVNSIGDPSDISAAVDLTVLRRSGAAIGFGAITSVYVSDFNEACQDAALAALTDSSEIDWTYNDPAGTASASLVAASVVFAKLQNIATATFAGRVTAGTGSIEQLSATNAASILSAVSLSTVGNFTLSNAGGKLLIKEGSNASMGTATLVAGTVTVNNTLVTANSRIFLTAQNTGGTPGALRISARVAATSFTITSSSATDTSLAAWLIIEPAP